MKSTIKDVVDRDIEKWERIAASWMQVARDRSDDAPDIANRARIRAAAYQDCAEDLKATIKLADKF